MIALSFRWLLRECQARFTEPMPHDSKNTHTFVFMGVSGCGKTTIASAFAKATGGHFIDGDDFHPPANVEKMRHAIPLDDSDRAGWIESLRDAIAGSDDDILCVACSALKKKHRDALRRAGGGVTFIHLHGPRELLAERLAERRGHFMPPGLLESQLADLEPPEDALALDISAPPEVLLAELRKKFAL